MGALSQSFAKKLSLELQARQGQSLAPNRSYQLLSQRTPQEVRDERNGRLAQFKAPVIDIYAEDITEAMELLSTGDYREAARIAQYCQSDGWCGGVLESFCASISRLPRKFEGDDTIKKALMLGYSGIKGDPRSLFDAIVRPSEVNSSLKDMLQLGTVIGELLWYDNLDFPIFARLDPQFLRQDRYTNTWTYRVAGELLEVRPGDGRWVLLTPGGAAEPWLGGIWASTGRDVARKTEAALNLDAWLRKHASPIRVGQTTQGSTPTDAAELLEALIEWSGVNTSCVLPPGWTLDLKETNGRGFESYIQTIKLANESLTVGIVGQTMSTTGGEGFSNGDVGLSILADRTVRYANEFANGMTEQVLPYVVARKWGSATRRVAMRLVTEKPKEAQAVATAMQTAATTASMLIDTYQKATALGLSIPVPDLAEVFNQLGVPTLPPEEPNVIANSEVPPEALPVTSQPVDKAS